LTRQHDEGPVVLINQFNIAPGDVERFPELWAQDAAFMKQRTMTSLATLSRAISAARSTAR
jgi:hypothetical protein